MALRRSNALRLAFTTSTTRRSTAGQPPQFNIHTTPRAVPVQGRFEECLIATTSPDCCNEMEHCYHRRTFRYHARPLLSLGFRTECCCAAEVALRPTKSNVAVRSALFLASCIIFVSPYQVSSQHCVIVVLGRETTKSTMTTKEALWFVELPPSQMVSFLPIHLQAINIQERLILPWLQVDSGQCLISSCILRMVHSFLCIIMCTYGRDRAGGTMTL